MENLEPYLDKFSESGRRVLKGALNETRRRDQHFISPEHILFALMGEETDLFDATMRELSISPQDVRFAVEKRLENSRQHTGKGFRIAPETTVIFKYSMDTARSQNRRVIEANDILYTLTTNRFDLLNDILQNPEGDVRESNASSIDLADNQSRFLSQLRIKPSNFLTQFSLRELVNENNSPSGLLFPKRKTGGIGGGLSSSGGDSEQTTNIKHETIFLGIKSEDSDKFDEEEFISSLRKDVENSINQSGLEITEANTPNSSSFHIKYKAEGMEGQMDISGEMKNGYYELKVMAVEKSGQKTKRQSV
ncbi:MAG: hypothetical protein M3367_13825 [Acidobacteriota bacterium]|nr:hypothetical protein [Acidobacteriota bacterium]